MDRENNRRQFRSVSKTRTGVWRGIVGKGKHITSDKIKLTLTLNIVITEQRNPNSTDIDLKSISEIVQIFHAEDRCAVEAVAAESDAITQAIEIIVDAFCQGGRLFYIGRRNKRKARCFRRV